MWWPAACRRDAAGADSRHAGRSSAGFCAGGAGEFIWGLLDGSRTLDQIREAVAAEFEVAPEQAARDLEEFIAELRQRELIVEVSYGGSMPE